MGRFWPNMLLFLKRFANKFFFPFVWEGFLHLTPTVNVQDAYHQHSSCFAGKRGLTWKILFICKKTKKTKKKVSYRWKAKYIWTISQEFLLERNASERLFLSSFCLSFSPQLVVFPLSALPPAAPLPTFSCTKTIIRFLIFFLCAGIFRDFHLFERLWEFPASHADRFLGADCLWICVFWCGAAAFFGANLSTAGLREASRGNPSTRLRLCQSPSFCLSERNDLFWRFA